MGLVWLWCKIRFNKDPRKGITLAVLGRAVEFSSALVFNVWCGCRPYGLEFRIKVCGFRGLGFSWAKEILGPRSSEGSTIALTCNFPNRCALQVGGDALPYAKVKTISIVAGSNGSRIAVRKGRSA